MPELRGSDRAAVREQLGRDPTTPFMVVARCGPSHPLVIRNHPIDAEGKPFPTLYWLTCTDAVRAVSRLESEGWIGRLNERAERDRAFRAALEQAHGEYAEERVRAVPEARDWGGVGGTRRGVKCLHAHYANHLAGGADPVGEWVAERIEPLHEPAGERVAVVDLGTNSVRVLVAERHGDEFAELARDMVITRIGQDVDRTGRLDHEALARTVRVLERYCRRARTLGASRIGVAATSAVRDASNREDLERAVRRLAGSEIEVLSGEREAELSFLGATRDLDAPPPFLVLDIGGGSTELVLGTERAEAAVSTQMGSVRLTERVRPADPPSGQDLRALARAVDEVLAGVDEEMAPRSARTLVAVAGTATTVQAVALDLEDYDPEAIHRTELSLGAAEGVLQRLAAMTVKERAALPVMAAGREDVIVAGASILVGVMRRWGFDTALVSEHDILDGLAFQKLELE